MNLYARAACVGKPVEWWFSSPNDPSDGGAKHRMGLAVCTSCPVKDLCRDDNVGEPEGLWGGVWRQQSRVHALRWREVRCERCGLPFMIMKHGRMHRCDRCLSADPDTHLAANKRASRARLGAR